MPLASGTKLGRYEIRSQVGAGGMGEVYRARDTELARDVAVKVLPSSYSADKDRLSRFKQEACAAGALNHPNILVVHDIGAHDGSPYVISELLEGENLRKCISGGSLSQRRAIDYALKIAQGLAAAHEKGIVHRDLKPDNIFITNDGRVKILDFGLAKLTQDDGNQHQTDIPTRRADTDPGVVMGTAGYMSPEQVRGQAVDHRSDIFSFGAILYEMLSGRRAFHGPSAADTMSAVLREDPPELSDSNKQISPALERLVNHCLEKNPAARFHSANDLAFALESLSGFSSVSTQTITAPPITTRRVTVSQLSWAIAAVALVGAIIFGYLYFRAPAPLQPRVMRFVVNPPEKTTIVGGGQHISPDGQRLTFVATGADGRRMLWTRPIDKLTAQPLSGTEDASNPFWSPDSRFIGFYAGAAKLKKIEFTGGPTQALSDVQVGGGGSWSKDGVILFTRHPADGLYRMSASGGSLTRATTLDESRKETAHAWPSFLPDGRHFLYFVRSAQKENTGIYVGTLDSSERKLLVSTDSNGLYSPPGFLLYLRERTLMAHAFNASTLQLVGEPFPVAEQIGLNAVTGRAFFSVSETGVLTFLSSNPASTQLVWIDRSGKQLGQVGSPAADLSLRLSPDDKQLAVSRVDIQAGAADIWLIDLTRNTPSRFTFDPATESAPLWSPDGSRILFASNRNGVPTLFQKLSNGTGSDEALFQSSEPTGPYDWSNDGKYILYGVLSQTRVTDLWILPLFGEKKRVPFLETDFSETQARFSPDGRWIAYTSNESGRYQVYVRSFPASDGKWQVSNETGAQPQWRNDGKELFFLAANRKLMAVEVNGAGPSFVAGVPKPLFDVNINPLFPGSPGASYYTARGDGQRFLVNTLVGESASTPLTVVTNWSADFRK